MKTLILIFTALMSLVSTPALAASKTLWKCQLVEVADHGNFEQLHDISFDENPTASVVRSNGELSIRIGDVEYGASSGNSVIELKTEHNLQIFMAYSDFNEDETSPVLYFEVLNPKAKQTIATVRYGNRQDEKTILLGSFRCQR